MPRRTASLGAATFAQAVACLALLVASSGRADEPAVPVEKIDAVVAEAMKKQKIPGVAVAVVHKGAVVLAKGYGEANVEHHVPVTADTVFQSGSVGKQLTAAAILALVEDGKLALDDPVTKFYPDAPEAWKRVTVRHLLTHTGGVPNYTDGTFNLQKDYTEDELAKMAFALKLDFEPGAKWRYSNTGYVLLGCLARKASGKFYGDVLRDRVFGPLGMKTARVITEADIIPNRAAGYRLVQGELKNQEWVAPGLNTTADGSLYLTLKDLIAWDKGLRDKAALKPESWAQIFTPVKLASGKPYPYGFGWQIDDDLGQPRHHHGGAWQGFTTYIARYLGDDRTVIVLTNLAGADPGAIAQEVAVLYNPKLAPSNEPIADKDPAVTKRVKELLAQARDGKLAADDFAFLPPGVFPRAAESVKKLLGPLGDPKAVDLVGYRERGDDRVFRYRVAFETLTVEVTATLGPDGKLAAFQLRPIALAK